MHPVDDWVSQAGHLSIDSPLIIEAISDSEHSNVDEDMVSPGLRQCCIVVLHVIAYGR